MHVIALRINLPDQRAGGPLRTDKGILTAYKIDVAQPKQTVVIRLINPGKCVDLACARLYRLPEKCLDVRLRACHRCQTVDGGMAFRSLL